jgi:phosphoserine phosphatase RsbU/P
MARVNRLIHEATNGDRFITTFYGLIDPDNKRLLYINAGHNPPLLLHEDGSNKLLEHGGLPLGIFVDSKYSESVVEFKSGDILVLYTDGVVEAVNARDEQFGIIRLQQLVRESRERRAYEIVQAVTSAVSEHSFDMDGPDDDLTILVIKVT